MKKKYIKPTATKNRTFTGYDLMTPTLSHSWDYVGAKEREAEEDEEIGERPNDYGIEPMTLW